jgi:hypothetical protein
MFKLPSEETSSPDTRALRFTSPQVAKVMHSSATPTAVAVTMPNDSGLCSRTTPSHWLVCDL